MKTYGFPWTPLGEPRLSAEGIFARRANTSGTTFGCSTEGALRDARPSGETTPMTPPLV
jgi:hypothetical protein